MPDFASLREFVTLQRGTTYQSARIGEPGPVLLGLGTIQRNGGFRGDDLRTYGGESADNLLLQPKDLFLSLKDVTQSADLLGAVAQVPSHVSVGRLTQDTVRLDIRNEGVPSDYLYWMLRTPQYRSYCRAHATGTTNLGLSREDFLSYQIPNPTRERKQLVELLVALDSKIAANTKIVQTVDDLLGALLANLLASTTVEEKALKEIADVNAESVNPAPESSLRYIAIAAVGVGRYDYPEIVDWGCAPSRARRRVRKGDTLWSTVRPNRRSHALNLSDDPLLVGSTGLAVLSPREIGFAYLYEVTKLARFTTYLESAAEGSAYPAVRADRFAEAPVPVLPTTAQETFESVAAPMRKHVFSLSEQNLTLTEMRDALLPQLMSGKIRVKDAEKTVEEAVL